MKKVILILCGALISTLSFAQYNVGTSTQQKDIWGNNTGTTVHRDSYGNVTGTSTEEKDIWGNSTGTTQQRSNNANTSIWSW